MMLHCEHINEYDGNICIVQQLHNKNKKKFLYQTVRPKKRMAINAALAQK